MKISANQIKGYDTIKKPALKEKNFEQKDLVQIGSEEKTSDGPDLKAVCKMGEPLYGHSITGNIRIHRNFHSNILNNDRDVLVYLPPGYSPDKKYPVLYIQDGQNIFNRDTSFGGTEWGVDETAERLIREGKIKDLIMVAIYNRGAERMSEYTPVPAPEHGGGNLDNYAAFVTEELKPFIDNTYSTSTEPSETGIMGSSLGGLSALYMGWNLPHIFGLTGVISPSLWWSDKYLIKEIEADPKAKGPSRVWLDMGTNESPSDKDNNGIPDTLDNSRAMGEVLLNKGYKFGEELFYHEEPGATHSEWSWNQRVDKVLTYLFGT
ncbi:MAG: alpha/beta hydrolase-fold protein [Candidatus Eremiobacterota bacterium]